MPDTIKLPESVRVLMPSGTVRTMNLEAYLRGVVAQEMPPSFDGAPEALKAQAVAARCYAAALAANPKHGSRGADLCTTEHCQAWTARARPATDAAVRSTRGVYLEKNGRLVWAFYSASCGGQTVDSERAGPGWKKVSYLRAIPCLCKRKRRGHGVGLCQWGARRMAERGAEYEAILKHYYRGVEMAGMKRDDLLEKIKAARWLAEEATRGVEALQNGGATPTTLEDVRGKLREATRVLYEVEANV